MSHPLFGPEIRMMLDEDDSEGLREFCANLHPATVAEALEELDTDQVWKVIGHAAIRDQANVFEYFPLERQVEIAEGGGQSQMARLIEQMSHDDRVDLLRRLPPRVADGLLRLVDEADRKDIATMMAFAEGTVGAIMTTNYAWLPAHLRAGEAIDRLRLLAPNSETIYYIYVLEEPTRKLLGVVSLRDLILNPRQMPVRELMETDPVTLKASDDRERAAQELARYDFLALPVVDDDNRLVGIVTHDDVIDVVVEEATEAVHKMGGLGPLAENYLEADFVTVWRTRAFWLSCLFGAELFTFTALAFFEGEIGKLVVLSLFVPLCISTGGNSGSQAATLITRAMALGQLGPGDWWRVFRHELLMGLVLGLTLGGIGFVRGTLTPESTRGGDKDVDAALMIKLPAGKEITRGADGVIELPEGSALIYPEHSFRRIALPGGASPDLVREGDATILRVPEHAKLLQPPVDRWRLGVVIALAVFGICLWGTIIGSMLPLVFRQFGVDPGIASSPFVATFVDVTGIVIYFSIAKAFLLN
ncbi:MAG: magnesium transporter [Gemmataceae bacterium]|nr:magnesium transporter [Gemmataceae bacterium]